MGVMFFLGIMGFILVALVMIILIFIGTCILQVFLSKTKNPWIGLILPSISFIVVLIISINTMINVDFYTACITFAKGNIITLIYLLIYFFVRRRKKKLDLASKNNNK